MNSIVGTSIPIGYIRTDHQPDIIVDYLFSVICRNCTIIVEQGQRNNGTDAPVAQPTAAPPPVLPTNSGMGSVNPPTTPAPAPVNEAAGP